MWVMGNYLKYIFQYWNALTENTVLKVWGLFLFFLVSYGHQDCIYLIKNTVSNIIAI